MSFLCSDMTQKKPKPYPDGGWQCYGHIRKPRDQCAQETGLFTRNRHWESPLTRVERGSPQQWGETEAGTGQQAQESGIGPDLWEQEELLRQVHEEGHGEGVP